jgi:hypothetical protein
MYGYSTYLHTVCTADQSFLYGCIYIVLLKCISSRHHRVASYSRRRCILTLPSHSYIDHMRGARAQNPPLTLVPLVLYRKSALREVLPIVSACHRLIRAIGGMTGILPCTRIATYVMLLGLSRLYFQNTTIIHQHLVAKITRLEHRKLVAA